MFVKKSANFAGNKAREELISSAKICWRAKDNFVYRSITTITIAQWIDNNIFKVSPFLRGTGINLIYFLERFSNLKNKLGSYFNLSRIFFPEGKKRSDQGSSQISTIQKLLSGGITTVRRHRIMLIGKNQGRARPFCTN